MFDTWQMLLWLQLTWQHQTRGCGAGSCKSQRCCFPGILTSWALCCLALLLKGLGDGCCSFQPGTGASGAASGRIHAANRSHRSHKNGVLVPCPCQQPEPLEFFPAEELAPGGAAASQPYKHRSAVTSPGSQCLPSAAPYNRFHGSQSITQRCVHLFGWEIAAPFQNHPNFPIPCTWILPRAWKTHLEHQPWSTTHVPNPQELQLLSQCHDNGERSFPRNHLHICWIQCLTEHLEIEAEPLWLHSHTSSPLPSMVFWSKIQLFDSYHPHLAPLTAAPP